MYRRVFGEIFFCGTDDYFWPRNSSNDFSVYLPASDAGFSECFAPIARGRGSCYSCPAMALDSLRHRNFTGVLVIGDDLVFNYWNAAIFNKKLDKSWLFEINSVFDIDTVKLNFFIKFSLNFKIEFQKKWMK